jgi:hypothetical protein
VPKTHNSNLGYAVYELMAQHSINIKAFKHIELDID